jgi:hypothetical protein
MCGFEVKKLIQTQARVEEIREQGILEGMRTRNRTVLKRLPEGLQTCCR